ncbi:mechanosensitive ion channel protein [filamentous cyanobacterium LEGE 11480]|uniref:Mechanosensitive ion channel protein n=1 Tax=Romeriopsis navalis LEGE 11480 TaxID=2777977 RepID=A0A928Z743_9CYAN|nr:hypothetical protein [Romeriopsis navalis]MBE9032840.1 mechanosensitive ion channel protein [Romeriopsis navalis LEGE 11480]
MLILKEAHVEPCRVIQRQQDSLKSYPGVIYQGKLFRRLKQFPGPSNQAAITMARQVYQKTQEKYLVLVVEEEAIHSVWSEDQGLQRANDPKVESDPIMQMDLEGLVSRLRDVGGVAIKDRRYHLKNYSRCFVGSDAVDWLVEQLKMSPLDALRLGQRLVDEHWIHHVTHDHGFENAELFYRFYWDDQA